MRRKIQTYAAVFLSACAFSSSAASAQTYNNDMLWRINSPRKFIITNSVPTDCQYPVYAASQTWNSSAVNVQFIWGGYINDYAYIRDANGNFVEYHNTPDTWVQVAPIDTPNTWGIMQPKYDASLYNSSLNPPRFAADADHVINYNRMGEFYCGSGTPTDTMRDMQSHALHEYGHTWGLGHDSLSTNATAVMYADGLKGAAGTKRSLLLRDIKRGQYLHGSK